MMIATVMELVGAMTLGTFNATTIRGGIINTAPFKDNGGALMFGMLCVLMSSSTLNFLSNRYGWATSSTHAIIGALIGVGVASGAGVSWGYIVTTSGGQVTGQNGLGAVVASFVISPLMAGIIAALIYAFIKYGILEKGGARSFRLALNFSPFIYATVAAFEAWLIGWKSPRLPKITDAETVGLFFGTFAIVFVLTFLFVRPYIRRSAWDGWSGLQLWHMPLMILPDSVLIAKLPHLATRKPWFDDRHLRGEEIPEDEAWQWTEPDCRALHAKRHGKGQGVALSIRQVDSTLSLESAESEADSSVAAATDDRSVPATPSRRLTSNSELAESARATFAGAERFTVSPVDEHGKPKSHWTMRKEQFWVDYKGASSWLQRAKIAFVFVFFIGVDRDIADYKASEPTVMELHDAAKKYYGRTEQVFRFLQVLTSALASFSHGANDVALSAGPLSVLYYYWQNGGRGRVLTRSNVLDWQLAVGAMSMVAGLWLYGYNMMRALGSRMTYHSPARGFSMELGAAITVLIAARNGIPVSTTNCIVGATVGVGLMNANWRAVNWKLFALTAGSWVVTIPFTALLSGLIFAFATYSPDINCRPVTLDTMGAAVKFNGAMVNSSSLAFYPSGC